MKIYGVEVSGGDWEDSYNYISDYYMSRESAENKKRELEEELHRLIQLEEVTSNCDRDNATDEQCEKCMACNNIFHKVYENETYVIKKIEVLD